MQKDMNCCECLRRPGRDRDDLLRLLLEKVGRTCDSDERCCWPRGDLLPAVASGQT